MGALISSAVCIDVDVVDSTILDRDLHDSEPTIGECISEGPPCIYVGTE